MNSPCGRSLALALLLLCQTSCGAPDQEPTSGRHLTESLSSHLTSLDTYQREWVERTLSQLTVREMAAQVIVAWAPGNYVSTDSDEFDETAALIDRGVGGLWLMGGLPHARTAKLNALQSRARVPMLVTGDELGHQLFSSPRDRWMLGGGTDIPSPMAYGAIGDPSAAREAARIVGLEVRATGANFFDDGGGANVLTNLDNVLHNRTYGDDPERVGQLVAAFVEGVHDAGVLSYVGFFPGAGGIGKDPHVELPVDRNSREHFQNIDFVPFRAAIGAGVDIVMTGHFAAPALTGSDSLPATFSTEVVRILREELGFDGLIITDDLSMGAISSTFTSKAEAVDAAIRAFKAGHDLLLGVFEIETADRLAELVDSGDIPMERLRASVRRILEAKARLRLYQKRTAPLEAVDVVVGNREHQRAADAAADRSIVLLRDAQNLVPFSSPSDLRVLSVTLERADNEEAGSDFNAVLREHVRAVDPVRLSPSSDPSVYDDLARRAGRADRVIFSVYLRPQLYEGSIPLPDAFVGFVRQLQEEGRDVVLVTFGKLRVLDRLPDLGTFMLAWSEQLVMQRAAARALLGMVPISGRLPVALPPHHRTGDGLSTQTAIPDLQGG